MLATSLSMPKLRRLDLTENGCHARTKDPPTAGVVDDQLERMDVGYNGDALDCPVAWHGADGFLAP